MTSEAQIQQQIRVLAPHYHGRLWRNNSGVLPDQTGRPIRFGLGNDSSRLNAELKSSDLIGFTPVLIEQRHVGHWAALFTAIEVKASGWKAPRNDRERAQKAFLDIVSQSGGVAAFASDPLHYQQAIERWVR